MLRGLSRLVSADADRAPDADFWYGSVGAMTAAGVRVTPESAMRSSTVLACVRLISQTLGSVPAIVYERKSRGKERAIEHPLYRLLKQRPNERQTAMEFYEQMTAKCTLRGNAYALPLRAGNGELLELWPMANDRMQVDELPGQGGRPGALRYLYTDSAGAQWKYNEDEIFHLRGMGTDSRMGLSVIGHGALTIGISQAAEQYAARFFANDATPGGVLLHPNHFKDPAARKEFAQQWREAQSGANRGRTAVLEDGLKYEALGMTNTDAQFLEGRRYQVADIARLFGVPLQLLNEMEKATSWGSGVEQIMLAFVMYTIRPWAIRWEQALQRDFLADDALPEDPYMVEFLLDALLRGDMKSRYEAYSKGITDGHLTRNEARELENRNPLPGLDEPLTPMNMNRGNEGDKGTRPKPRREDDEEEGE